MTKNHWVAKHHYSTIKHESGFLTGISGCDEINKALKFTKGRIDFSYHTYRMNYISLTLFFRSQKDSLSKNAYSSGEILWNLLGKRSEGMISPDHKDLATELPDITFKSNVNYQNCAKKTTYICKEKTYQISGVKAQFCSLRGFMSSIIFYYDHLKVEDGKDLTDEEVYFLNGKSIHLTKDFDYKISDK